ncbi:MAG: undecaprenyl/decaprenyl-phosphate alpha-N-acetylglucosaminyl 1-phosphate transferase [Elusimicrobia bacterium]|nr:undecaprenyl/decaprenyl-phosphate alpha-N-acetylglucosaminyl 1-phosphate transferase [Candidatus Liberimonas magnetica]
MKDNDHWRKAYYVLLAILLVILIQPSGGTWAFLLGVRWLYILMLSFVCAQLLVPVTIKLAFKYGVLDHPDQERKIHKSPIPRIGGTAIFLAIILTCLRNFKFTPEFTSLIIGSSIIYLTGFIDDIHPLSAMTRIIAQLIACFIVINSGICMTIIPYGVPFKKTIEVVLTVIWLIGIANALNFLDGVDGLAAGMTALCASLFFVISLPTHQKHLGYLSIAITGSCLGFLTYNWKPAVVYMGDAGATFLGFLLAGLSIMGGWAYNSPLVSCATPILILGIPIFDMIYITISRIKNGQVKTFTQWLEYTGRDHFHHRLMHLGLSEVQTVIFILAVNLCIGLGAIVVRDTETRYTFIVLFQSTLIFLIITVLMILGKDRTIRIIENNK